jgi:hypothetical protein
MNRRHHVILGILAHCFTTAGALGVIILSEDNGRADDVVREITDLLPLVNKFTQPAIIEIKTVKRHGDRTQMIEVRITEGKLSCKCEILVIKPHRGDQMLEVRGREPTIVYADRLVSGEHLNIMAAQIGRSTGINEGIQLWDEPHFYRR